MAQLVGISDWLDREFSLGRLCGSSMCLFTIFCIADLPSNIGKQDRQRPDFERSAVFDVESGA